MAFHDLSVRPWSFIDSQMEIDYQQNSVRFTIDRLRFPLSFIAMPYGIVSRITLLPMRILSWEPWSFFEIYMTLARSILFALTIYIIHSKWDSGAKSKLGAVLIMVYRCLSLIGALQHSGINQYDNRLLDVHVIVLFFSGIVFSTIEEYLLVAISTSFVKPISLAITLWRGSCDTSAAQCSQQGLWVVLAQHSLLLLIGVGVNWLMHCDRRKEWLLTQRPLRLKSQDAAAACTAPDGKKPDKCSGLAAWGTLDDGYGCEEERAELAVAARHESAVMRAREAALAGAAEPVWRQADRLLGSGAAGRVYLAHLERGGLRCAVKVVDDVQPPPAQADRAALERRLRALATREEERHRLVSAESARARD